MSEDVYLIEIEQVLEDWTNREIELDCAVSALKGLGHSEREAHDMLATHDQDLHDRQLRLQK